MDRFDHFTLLALLVVALAVGGLLFGHRGAVEAGDLRQARLAAMVRPVDPQLDKKLDIAGNLLAAGAMAKAKGLLTSLEKQHPYEGRVFMLMAEYYIHRQQPIQAMLEHRKAIELNPDFLDRKTAVFQGKVIKNNLKEAQALIEAGLKREPQDAKWQKYREVMYYMQRRIAGSCG